MAQTTMFEVRPEDEWVKIGEDLDSSEVCIKANNGNWKSWRTYFSEDGTTPDKLTGDEMDPGDLYSGNIKFYSGTFSGSLFLAVEKEPIVFSVTKTSYASSSSTTIQDDPNDTGISFWDSDDEELKTSSSLTWDGEELYVDGDITATGEVTANASDERLKDFQGNITGALDKLEQIGGYYFQFNKFSESFGYKNKRKQVGVSAQELQKVLPEAVKIAPFDKDKYGGSKSGEEYLTVSYEKIVPLLIEAIKEQEMNIHFLEKEIKLLKNNY